MRKLVVLLLIGCLAGSHGRQLQQSRCPVANCDTSKTGACTMVANVWKCNICKGPREPNKRKTDCVCPAGYFPASNGQCRPCAKNFFCVKGESPLVSTAMRCPDNMVTKRTGAKSLNDCLNAPGFYYQRLSTTVVRAIPCPDDTYSRGLDRASSCTPCPANFKTDPENTAGSHTSADVCLAPPGLFVSGETVVPCPKGEFQPDYGYITSCKSCADVLGEGVTTPSVGATSAADCRWPEAGYMLLDSGGRGVFSLTGSAVTQINKVTGASSCPAGYFCLGGDPSTNTNIVLKGATVLTAKAYGVPQPCPNGLTTEKPGAFSLDQCVAPPGKWGDLTTPVTDCPSGTFKEAWARASTPADGCIPCGLGLWLSEKNYRVAYTDIYGQLMRQELVRGSSESCYIQKGMGTERSLTTNVLTAVICPRNTYGIVGDTGLGRKYGQLHTPCTACPANMITGYKNTPQEQAGSVAYHINDAGGLSTSALLNGTFLEPATSVATTVGTSSDTGSGNGYFHVKACVSRPGYGYYEGASQRCKPGFYNAAGNDRPCQQCPPGTTTTTNPLVFPAAISDCNFLSPGYTLNSLADTTPVQCPAGTWSNMSRAILGVTSQYDLDRVCTACPAGSWSLEPGMTSQANCTLCAPGFGGSRVSDCITFADTSAVCKDGKYGPASRTTNPCLACPAANRTFSFAWLSTSSADVFTPSVTSPPYATGVDDCLADFAQIVDGPFYLNLLNGSCFSSVADVTGLAITNLQTCVSMCAARAGCAAATFDYQLAAAESTDSCKLWTPATGTNVAQGGIALKTMPAYVDDASAAALVSKKDMGSGYYSQYMGSSAADCIAGASLLTASAADLQGCFDACSMRNECAGVKFQNITGTSIESCQLIMATLQPGASKRTLVRAVANSMVSGCPPGARVMASNNTQCEPCPDGEYWGGSRNFGTTCNACAPPNKVTSGRTKCEAATSCSAGQQYNPFSPTECIPCPAGTYKATAGAGECITCSYEVGSNRTTCQKKAPCGRGQEYSASAPGTCATCELPGYFKDTPDANEASPMKCQLCNDVGSGRFQNTLDHERQSCLNNCNGGSFYDDTDTASRKDPTRCLACSWPRVKAAPAPTACVEVCDVRNTNLSARTTPSSDRTRCVRPVICGRGEQFDRDFPEDIARCQPCPAGYQNDDGVWLCVQSVTGTTATCTSDGQEQDPNASASCAACAFPLYGSGGTCNSTCATGSTPLAGSTTYAGIGSGINSLVYTATSCMQQCDTGFFWDNNTCQACATGSVRPRGSPVLTACTACGGGTVAWQGFCVTPVTCPNNTQSAVANPLDVETCT